MCDVMKVFAKRYNTKRSGCSLTAPLMANVFNLSTVKRNLKSLSLSIYKI